MTPLQDLLIVMASWLAGGVVILLVSRYLSRRAASPNEGDPPLYLAGSWPASVQSRYQAMDVEGRRRFWKRLNWTRNWLILPLFAAAAIAAFVFKAPVFVVVLIAWLIFPAMWYAVSGR